MRLIDADDLKKGDLQRFRVRRYGEMLNIKAVYKIVITLSTMFRLFQRVYMKPIAE